MDDVFLDVATWSGVGRPRSALARLTELSGRLNLHEAATVCAGVRPMPRSPAFSVTANFVGQRNYNTHEIKQACAEGIGGSHHWPYAPDDAAADLNVRIFIEHDTAFVGLRLGRYPLHRRPYKQAHVPGSLKPPVAAALLRLAGVAPGARVLDPCCGAGTLLVEAALGGALALGGDCDPVAVVVAQANARSADVAARLLLRWDAQRLPLADASVDRIVSNLPWGRAVEVDTSLASFYQRVCSEMRRVVAPGGRMVVLTNAPHLVHPGGLRCEQCLEISLFGQTPTAMVFSA